MYVTPTDYMQEPPEKYSLKELDIKKFNRWMAKDRNGNLLAWVKQYLKSSAEFRNSLLTHQIQSPHFELLNKKQIAKWLAWFYSIREGVIEIQKMKTAWSQEKYRGSLSRKKEKHFSFVLHEDVGKILSDLSKHCNLPKNKTIELLLKNEAYKTTKGNALISSKQHTEYQGDGYSKKTPGLYGKAILNREHYRKLLDENNIQDATDYLIEEVLYFQKKYEEISLKLCEYSHIYRDELDTLDPLTENLIKEIKPKHNEAMKTFLKEKDVHMTFYLTKLRNASKPKSQIEKVYNGAKINEEN